MTARTLTLGRTTYPVVLPNTRDPRLHVAAVIITIHVLGQFGLGFRVSVPQILAAILTCAVLEVALTFRTSRAFVWPASAMLTGSGVALILRVPGTPADEPWSIYRWYVFAGVAALSLLTKYVIRYRGSHLFNPSNIGLVVAFVVLGSERVEPLDFLQPRRGRRRARGDRFLPGRPLAGAGSRPDRSDCVRPPGRAGRAHGRHPAVLRRRRLRPPGPAVRGRRAGSRARPRAAVLHHGDGHQPQLLQHRVDTGPREVARLGRLVRRPRSAVRRGPQPPPHARRAAGRRARVYGGPRGSRRCRRHALAAVARRHAREAALDRPGERVRARDRRQQAHAVRGRARRVRQRPRRSPRANAAAITWPARSTSAPAARRNCTSSSCRTGRPWPSRKRPPPPRALQVDWTRPGGSVRIPVTPASGHGDALDFRIAGEPGAAPVEIDVRVRDAAGAWTALGQRPMTLRSYHGLAPLGKVVARQLRAPLGGLDAGRITAIELIPRTPRGRFWLLDVSTKERIAARRAGRSCFPGSASAGSSCRRDAAARRRSSFRSRSTAKSRSARSCGCS